MKDSDKQLLGIPSGRADFDTGMVAFRALVLAAVACVLLGAPAVAQSTPSPAVPDDILTEIEEVIGRPAAVEPQGLELKLNAPGGLYREGDFITITVKAPEYDGYVYLDYYQIDGNVVHVLPDPDTGEAKISLGRQITVGTPESGVTYEVFPPFGRELLVLYASPEPLFDQARNEFEDGIYYLKILRQRLEAKLPGEKRRSLAVAYQPIQTFSKDAVISRAPPEPEPEEPPAAAAAAVEPAAPEPAAPQPTPLVEAAPEPIPVEPKAKPESIEIGESRSAALTPAPSPPPGEEEILRLRINELLQRMQQAPQDETNLTALVGAYQDYAQHLVARDEFDKASRSLAMAMALDPDNQELAAFANKIEVAIAVRQAYDDAEIQLNANRADLAYEALDRVLALDPEQDAARQQLADLAPEAINSYYMKAMIAFRRQDLDQALAIWDKVLTIDPNNDKARLNRLRALDLQERLQKLQSTQ